jgi:hypothetical protein
VLFSSSLRERERERENKEVEEEEEDWEIIHQKKKRLGDNKIERLILN